MYFWSYILGKSEYKAKFQLNLEANTACVSTLININMPGKAANGNEIYDRCNLGLLLVLLLRNPHSFPIIHSDK